MRFFSIPCSFAALLVCLASRLYGADETGYPEYKIKIVPHALYELRYLGCDQKEDPQLRSHVGHFLFIWKSDKETQIREDAAINGKSFVPQDNFVIHCPTGWIYKGNTGMVAPGTRWVTVQPGQVMKFNINMFYVEHESMPNPLTKGKDKAHLELGTKLGEAFSDDFCLPLIPEMRH